MTTQHEEKNVSFHVPATFRQWKEETSSRDLGVSQNKEKVGIYQACLPPCIKAF